MPFVRWANMPWLEQWRALAARIDGLLRAAKFLTSTFKVSTADTLAVVRKSFHLVLTTIIADLGRIASI